MAKQKPRPPRKKNNPDAKEQPFKPRPAGKWPAQKPSKRPTRERPEETMRLNRYIAQSGICSRREADTLIAEGKVTVNGATITAMGHKVRPGIDQVSYQGKALIPEKKVYVLYNKPKNTLTTSKDPQGRFTVMDALRKVTRERIYPVGRLDRNTTGLLLLTNDGELAKKPTHPSFEVKKVYKVRLNRPVPPEHLVQLREGITLEDGLAKVDKVDYILEGSSNEIGLEIHIGRNRIVRRLFEALGYQVVALDRTMLGHLTKKNLPRGKWRHLTEAEIGRLKGKSGR